MFSSLAAFFTRNFSHEKEENNNKEANKKVTNFVCRDDLNKKPSTNKPKKGGKKVSFASDVIKPQLAAGENGGKNLEGLIIRRSHASNVEEKGAMRRVKVRMTKAEAARLLSKCQDGGIIGFKDVANELTQIPINRVDAIASPDATE